MSKHKPLQVTYNPYSDVLTVDGTNFSGEFFRFFTFKSNEGKLFRLIEVADGDATIKSVEEVNA